VRTNTHETEDLSLHAKACWEVIERAAQSTHLNRAARLREFLFYVGAKSLKESSADVHEQEIGAEVFGRPEHYDTSQDNIVRVNATELRKRINAYFAAEGIHEPLIFQIPRGSYTPMFHWRADAAPPVLVPEEKSPAVLLTLPPALLVEPAISPYRRPPFLLAAASALLLAILSVTLWMQNQSLQRLLHPWQGQPALSLFWPRFLDAHRPTDIVLADTSFALIQDLTGRTYSLSEYLNRNYMQQDQTNDSSPERRADAALIFPRINTGLGDLRATQHIQALDPTSPSLALIFAREYSADSLKRHNVILIGGQKSNPWVALFNDQLNFTIDYDRDHDLSFVRNHNPQPGEQATYATPAGHSASIGYSIIAYLPNPSHTAESLILAGTDSQATDAAGEFITSEQSLAGFLKRIHANTKQIPHFEVLLRNTRLSGTSFNAEILAYRTY
jgi:hypothetical protein